MRYGTNAKSGYGVILYDGRDVRITAKLFDNQSDQCVVTFTGRQAIPQMEVGFGESFLAKRRISAVHFISKTNHWWQTPEMPEAIGVLRREGLVCGSKHLTLYGSSMGGFAALVFSRAMEAHRIIVFSPQYSINPKRVPFENRWIQYAARLKFDFDDMDAGLDRNAEIKAVFDPFFEADLRHIELVERHRPVERVPVPFAGHSTARVLGELGILTAMTEALLTGTFDALAFRVSYRRLRAASCLFWFGLAEALESTGHRSVAVVAGAAAATAMLRVGRMNNPPLRAEILRRAIIAASDAGKHKVAMEWLAELDAAKDRGHNTSYARARAFGAAGDWAQALHHIDLALAGDRSNIPYLCFKAMSLLYAQGPSSALAYWATFALRVQNASCIHLVRAQALAAEKRWKEALNALASHFKHDRDSPEGRILCARCWSELGRPDASLKQLRSVIRNNVASADMAAEIFRLLRDGGHETVATAFNKRQRQFASRFQSLLTAIGETDWKDRDAGLAEFRARLKKHAGALAAKAPIRRVASGVL